MLDVTLVRHLTLNAPTSEGRGLYLAAASGLVQVGELLYVVADDENHLGIFKAHALQAAGTTMRLLEGVLPEKYKKRKAAKPDFEVLLRLPAFEQYPQGALLALGSGSKPTRQRGVLLGLTADGTLNTAPLILDWSELYKHLETTFPQLNIEGAFIQQAFLYLLQRGNKSEDAENAVIQLALNQVMDAILAKKAIPKHAVLSIKNFPIGTIADVPLCFTDACALPDGNWVFSAAAEATDDSYDDGAFLGGALGLVDAHGELRRLELIDKQYKVEGISAKVNGLTLELLLVTDADDASKPASLLTASLTGYPFIT